MVATNSADPSIALYSQMETKLLQLFLGQTVLIKDGKLAGLFVDPITAYLRAATQFPNESVLIKTIGEPEDKVIAGGARTIATDGPATP